MGKGESQTSGRRTPSQATVVAWVALFIALGGAAAGLPGRNSVDSQDIENGRVRAHDLDRNSVRASEVRDGSIHSAEVQDGAIAQADLAAGSVGAPQILDGAIGPEKLGTVPAVRVGTPQEGPPCATQSIANNASEIVQFTQELYDTQNLHEDPPADCSAGTQSRLTAPMPGIYLVIGSVTWDNDPTGETKSRHPADRRRCSARSQSRATTDWQFRAQTRCSTSSTIVELDAGDYVELRVDAGFRQSARPPGLRTRRTSR